MLRIYTLVNVRLVLFIKLSIYFSVIYSKNIYIERQEMMTCTCLVLNQLDDPTGPLC